MTRRHRIDPALDHPLDYPLDPALAHHRAGRLDMAERLYRDALARHPGHHAARHLLGVVAHQRGHHAEAAALIAEAVRDDPAMPDYHGNLGLALAALGRTGQAADRQRRALVLRPDYPEAHLNLGLVLATLGDAAGGVACLARALRLRPGFDPARTALAELLHREGCRLRDLGRVEDAARRFAEAAAHRPDDAALWNDLGTARAALGQAVEARAAWRRAVQVGPDRADALTNLALATQTDGDADAAERLFGRALALHPDLPVARANRGLLRLERGDLAGGWPDYGWRFAADPANARRPPPLPAWRGEELSAKRLLIWGEQGIGDTILFSSACADAVARARAVTIEVDRRLVPLFARSFPAARVRPRGAGPVPDCDIHVPVGSLPRVFRTRLSDFPARTGWLTADPEQAARWRDRLAALGPGPRVGIAWRSLVVTPRRQSAGTALDDWAPLFALPGLHLVSLQPGDAEAETAAAEARFGVRIHRWPDHDRTDDLDGTAALIAGLDLVITPAVSAGELAGALGVPVWRIGRRDWTGLGTAARPWFPAMRLFRPPPGGTLADALVRAADALAGTRVNFAGS